MKTNYIRMSKSIYYDEIDVDCSDISGTNCYCDDVAMKKIEERLIDVPLCGIHYIDSGNYHYMTLPFLRRIDEDFALVVFDNHTDYQEVAFGGLTSCGAWIREAVDTIPRLKQVVLIGAEAAACEETEFDNRVSWLGWNQNGEFVDSEETVIERAELAEFVRSKLEPGLPVYVSIDKDVLAEGECKADWSQGIMTMADLRVALSFFKEKNMLGVDVCGGPDDLEDYEGNESNREVDEVIKEIFRG